MHTSKESPKQVSKKGGYLSLKENEWFDVFIHQVRSHQLMLDTKSAPKALEDMYRIFFSGDQMEASKLSKRAADQTIIKKAVLDYINEISSTSVIPKKLSFDLSDCHVLVWAEIAEEDEKIEDILILAEAKVNQKYNNFGIDISSTILEDCDNIPVPTNYLNII